MVVPGTGGYTLHLGVIVKVSTSICSDRQKSRDKKDRGQPLSTVSGTHPLILPGGEPETKRAREERRQE